MISLFRFNAFKMLIEICIFKFSNSYLIVTRGCYGGCLWKTEDVSSYSSLSTATSKDRTEAVRLRWQVPCPFTHLRSPKSTFLCTRVCVCSCVYTYT